MSRVDRFLPIRQVDVCFFSVYHLVSRRCHNISTLYPSACFSTDWILQTLPHQELPWGWIKCIKTEVVCQEQKDHWWLPIQIKHPWLKWLVEEFRKKSPINLTESETSNPNFYKWPYSKISVRLGEKDENFPFHPVGMKRREEHMCCPPSPWPSPVGGGGEIYWRDFKCVWLCFRASPVHLFHFCPVNGTIFFLG